MLRLQYLPDLFLQPGCYHEFKEGHGDLLVGAGSKFSTLSNIHFPAKGGLQVLHDNLPPETENMKSQVANTLYQKIRKPQGKQHEQKTNGA